MLEKFIENRLKQIQKRNNFNPSFGKIQIKNSPNKLNDYVIFKEYLNLIKKCNLDIDINFDELSLNKNKTIKVAKESSYVYFARSIDNNRIWKIGKSITPYKRGQAIQTSNHEYIKVIYQIPGDYKLENLIKKYTSNFKTDGGTEWRNLDKSEIELIVKRIKANDIDFLTGPKLKNS